MIIIVEAAGTFPLLILPAAILTRPETSDPLKGTEAGLTTSGNSEYDLRHVLHGEIVKLSAINLQVQKVRSARNFARTRMMRRAAGSLSRENRLARKAA